MQGMHIKRLQLFHRQSILWLLENIFISQLLNSKIRSLRISKDCDYNLRL